MVQAIIANHNSKCNYSVRNGISFNRNYPYRFWLRKLSPTVKIVTFSLITTCNMVILKKWIIKCVYLSGTTNTFRGYGLLCAVVLAAFIFINFYRKDTGFVSDLPQTEDPHQVAEATHLAPHGVPSNAIPRALSSSRLHELAQDPGYGATYQTAGGNLGVPGANSGQYIFFRFTVSSFISLYLPLLHCIFF